MNYSFKTFLKHTAKDFHNQSVNPPVVRASTIIFKSTQDIRKTQNKARKDPTGGHFDYGRQGTSTTHILSKILTKLEEIFLTYILVELHQRVYVLRLLWMTLFPQLLIEILTF